MSFYIIEPNWNKKQKRYADILRAKLGVEPNIEEIKSKLLSIRRHSAAHIDLLVERLRQNTRDLGMALEVKLSELYWIGDCKQPRTLVESMYEGLLVGQEI